MFRITANTIVLRGAAATIALGLWSLNLGAQKAPQSMLGEAAPAPLTWRGVEYPPDLAILPPKPNLDTYTPPGAALNTTMLRRCGCLCSRRRQGARRESSTWV